MSGRNVIFEFESVTDDLVEAEMQCHRANLKIQRAGNEDVAISQVTRRVDQRLSPREYRRFQRDFKQIVGQPDQTVTVHPAIRAKRENIEERPRIQVQAKQ